VLEIEVRVDGNRAAGRPLNNVGGHGLMGMRERVGLHGGHLRAGVNAQGGFAVHATFPLNGTRHDDQDRSRRRPAVGARRLSPDP